MTPRNLIYRHDGDDGMQVRVWLINDEYRVTLIDLDAGLTMPCVRIFKAADRDAAIRHARRLVNA
jgi:hypothetical protein